MLIKQYESIKEEHDKLVEENKEIKQNLRN